MFTNYGAQMFGGVLFNDVTPPSQLWLSLILTLPTHATTGSTVDEPSAVDYDRVRLDTLTWNAVVSNGSDIRTLETPLVYLPANDWGDVSYYGICDASTAGNLILWGQMPNVLNCSTGRRIEIPANSITIQAV